MGCPVTVHCRHCNDALDVYAPFEERFCSEECEAAQVSAATPAKPRPPLEWKSRPVALLEREELIELVGVLHDMVWTTAEANERLIEQMIPHATAAGRA